MANHECQRAKNKDGSNAFFVDGVTFVWHVLQVDWRVLLVTEFSFGLFWRHDSDQNPNVYVYV